MLKYYMSLISDVIVNVVRPLIIFDINNNQHDALIWQKNVKKPYVYFVYDLIITSLQHLLRNKLQTYNILFYTRHSEDVS